MTNTPIIRIALPTPLRRLFDYLPPQGIDYNSLIPGVRVKVPFQSRTLVGILISVEIESSVPYEKLKPALEVLDTQSQFTADVYKLCCWAADYYHYALGEVLASALPVLLRKGKPPAARKVRAAARAGEADQPLPLNAEQRLAVSAVASALNTFKVFLLDGVTGSGKTEVYLQVMAENVRQGRQILVLVPEISLTPQTIERFRARFSVPVAALHSSLSEQERLRVWLAAKSGEAAIVIGTRSAVFTPFSNLGLIIVDEEHDPSFKQQDRFRYHARDLAIMRASYNQIPIVLGSATPSLESLLNVRRDRYELLTLPQRAGAARLPQYRLLDLRSAPAEEGLSPEMLNCMRHHLDQGNQVMLFLNRRGFAPVLYCTQCAWISGCKRCDARMVYHQSPPRLQCHHCDSRSHIPRQCPQCKEDALQPVGQGTQRVEQTLEKHFPEVPVIRVDRDSTQRKGAMESLLGEIHSREKAILLGTQMLAKGHHFPRVTLVGIIDADNGLFSADFRAAEQMGQLLVQVAGRAGRAEKTGTVVIQTRHPDHPLLQTLLREGYQTFARKLLDEREAAVLPPFSYFAVFRAEAYKEQDAADFLACIKDMLPASMETVTVLGPVPALLSKRKGLHCQHLLVKTLKRSVLQSALSGILCKLESAAANYSVKWMLDVDPVEV
ncbi:Primosomal protein N' [Aquicella siphonis]|uniref:Replication restart protein PriA n=1 Tax=Aquicella siphonis TaxID=254247 RepID=A0A5E4PEK5_9COXI|nr:primosomal protein N' [Aquicella siphonis]VVC74843.1 Primosomal protein N' [Aquicella siphonis]